MRDPYFFWNEAYKFFRAQTFAVAMLVLLGAGLLVSGCASTGGAGGGGINVQSAVAQVISATKQACGFVPVANDVAAVLVAMFPGAAVPVGGIQSAANLICSSPVLQGARRNGLGSARQVVVGGRTIVVHSQ